VSGGRRPTIEEVVGRVSIWAGKEVQARPLSGGLTNDNFLVEADGERYVVRIPGVATELLAVDRENERRNAEAAATTGVSPRVVEYLDDLQVMVLEFIEGRTMSAEALREPGNIPRIAASLRRLHAGPRFLKDFDMFRTVEYYLRICEERGIRMPDGYRDRMGDVAEVERALSARPVPTVPCHNDLLAENYIDDGTQLWIVDFEYSGNNDPCFELGDTAQECGFDDDEREALCAAYFGEATPALLARMQLQALMADVGWTLWAAIQEAISEIDYDFWGWAVERWERAESIFGSERFPRWLAAAAGG
jgi:thiamine kinase-like enzyme